MKRRKINDKSIKIDQNWKAVLVEFEAPGGISYQRDYDDPVPDGPGETQDYRTQKHVDHKRLVAEGGKIKDAARYVLRCHATKAKVFGWVATESAAKVIEVKLNELQADAADFNERAQRAGCGRRVYIEHAIVAFEINQPSVARQLSRTVRSNCQELIDTIRAGDVDGIDAVLLKAKNMGELAPSFFLEDSITYAIECAKRARTALKKEFQKQKLPKLPPKRQEAAYKAANKKVKAALRPVALTLDLEDIESCIGNWTDRKTLQAANAAVEAA